MRAHVIENNKIVNTVEVERLDFLPNLVDASIGGTIGDTVENGQIIPAPLLPLTIPQSVTMRQGRLALLQMNLLAQVSAAIDLYY